MIFVFQLFVLVQQKTENDKTGHIVKHGVEWICKTWSGFVKHGNLKGGFVKGGFVKHGFVKGGFVKHGFVKHGFVKGGFVKGGFVKHGFVKGGFVKHDNLKLKRATRKVRIFIFFAQIKSKTVQGTISAKNITVLKENRMLFHAQYNNQKMCKRLRSFDFFFDIF